MSACVREVSVYMINNIYRQMIKVISYFQFVASRRICKVEVVN